MGLFIGVGSVRFAAVSRLADFDEKYSVMVSRVFAASLPSFENWFRTTTIFLNFASRRFELVQKTMITVLLEKEFVIPINVEISTILS